MRGVAVNTDTDAKYGCKTYGLSLSFPWSVELGSAVYGLHQTFGSKLCFVQCSNFFNYADNVVHSGLGCGPARAWCGPARELDVCIFIYE